MVSRKNKHKFLSSKKQDQAKLGFPLKSILKSSVVANAMTRGDGWANAVTGVGIYGQDKRMGNQFVGDFIVSAVTLDNLYRGDAITQRIIDIFPLECTRKWLVIRGDENELIEKKFRELNFKENLRLMGKFARLYGGAIAVLGINDGGELWEEVDEASIKSIDYMHVYDRFQAWSSDGTYDWDLDSPNYGHPESYRVTDPMTAREYLVHYTRVLRMDGVDLPPRRRLVNNGWGDSIMVSCFSTVRDYCASMANMSTMFEDMVKIVLKIPNFTNIVASQAGFNAVQNRINTAALGSSNSNFLIIDSMEELEKHSTSLAGVADVSDRLALQLSAVVGVPASKLFGRSPTGLNATGHSELINFYDDVSAVQEQKYKRPVERMARLIMLAQDGEFKGKVLKDWEVIFNPLMQVTEKEQAEIHKLQAEADKVYLEMGALSVEELRQSRFGRGGYNMETNISGSSKVVKLKQAPAQSSGQDIVQATRSSGRN